jgi:hypothetical protein
LPVRDDEASRERDELIAARENAGTALVHGAKATI